MRTTLKDVAERAGVSQMAVSQVLSKSRRGRISAERQREIRRIARQLNYQPRNVTTHTIGCVLPVKELGLEEEVYFLQKLHTALAQHGYRWVLADYDTNKPQALRQTLNPKTVDGIIALRWYDGVVREVLSDKIPFVVASDQDGIPDDVTQIAPATQQVAREAAEYLLNLGHRRFCLVTGIEGVAFHGRIKRGVCEAMEQRGVRDEVALVEVVEATDVAPCLSEIMQRKRPPTAIIASGTTRVAASLNVLQSSGYRVPEQVSLVSLFDSPRNHWLRPSITAVEIEPDFAEQVAACILDKIGDPDLSPHRVLVPGRLVIRESAAAPIY